MITHLGVPGAILYRIYTGSFTVESQKIRLESWGLGRT